MRTPNEVNFGEVRGASMGASGERADTDPQRAGGASRVWPPLSRGDVCVAATPNLIRSLGSKPATPTLLLSTVSNAHVDTTAGTLSSSSDTVAGRPGTCSLMRDGMAYCHCLHSRFPTSLPANSPCAGQCQLLSNPPALLPYASFEGAAEPGGSMPMPRDPSSTEHQHMPGAPSCIRLTSPLSSHWPMSSASMVYASPGGASPLPASVKK